MPFSFAIQERNAKRDIEFMREQSRRKAGAESTSHGSTEFIPCPYISLIDQGIKKACTTKRTIYGILGPGRLYYLLSL